MKTFQTIAAYVAVLALTGVATLRSAEPGTVQGKAIVRSVEGTATYTTAAGVNEVLKPNMELPAGTMITTGPDSVVFLNINGLSSAVRIQAETTMAIPTMDRIGSGRQGDTTTMLDLKVGSILGQVKKVSANSKYEIKTPHGVAGIRGTDFQVTVQRQTDGTYMVTFTSVKGVVIASAVVSGEIQTRTLHDGESWTPGNGDVHPTPLQLLNAYAAEINEAITAIQQSTNPNNPVTVPIKNPYTGAPPNQNPGSPDTTGSGT